MTQQRDDTTESNRTNDRSEGGDWQQMKGRAREKWGKLTDEDLDEIDGRRDRLAGRIQARYERTADDANKEADEFFGSQKGDRR